MRRASKYWCTQTAVISGTSVTQSLLAAPTIAAGLIGMGSMLIACCLGLLSLLDFGLGLAEIVMGSLHIGQCPAQNLIPIYLLVIGVTGIVKSAVNVVRSKIMRNEEQAEKRRQALLQPDDQPQQTAAVGSGTWSLLANLLSIFTLIWIICGMVWIFGTSPSFNTDSGKASTPASQSDKFCPQPLYIFAQALVLIRLITLCLYFLGLCCCVCCMGCLAAASSALQVQE